MFKRILAIETSCDETACAVVEDGVKVLASNIASSAEFHEKTGGIVPEVAARKQVEFIIPIITKTLQDYAAALGVALSDEPHALMDFAKNNLDALASTVGPGLIGSLLVGVEAAKTLSVALDKPIIPVNHLVGHIYANFITSGLESLQSSPALPVNFPCVVLIVSGGHTDLILMKGHGDFDYLGGTLDDAAGEAFDKTARLLKLSNYFMGGPVLSKVAADYQGDDHKKALPRPMLDRDNFDFSFSGLKTAVWKFVENSQLPNQYPPLNIPALAKDFEDSVTEVLVQKTIKAAVKYGVKDVLIGGGVSANRVLREKFTKMCKENALVFHVPPVDLCNDNAIYIASAAFFNPTAVDPKDGDLDKVQANSSLGIMDKV